MGIVTVIYALVVLVIVLAVNNTGFLEFLTRSVELGGLEPAAFVAENGEVAMGYVAQYYRGPLGFYVIIVGALFSMLSDATASLDDVTVERRLLEHDDVVAALVDESANHDLTIIGATREGLIQKFVFGTIPETVAERA